MSRQPKKIIHNDVKMEKKSFIISSDSKPLFEIIPVGDFELEPLDKELLNTILVPEMDAGGSMIKLVQIAFTTLAGKLKDLEDKEKVMENQLEAELEHMKTLQESIQKKDKAFRTLAKDIWEKIDDGVETKRIAEMASNADALDVEITTLEGMLKDAKSKRKEIEKGLKAINKQIKKAQKQVRKAKIAIEEGKAITVPSMVATPMTKQERMKQDEYNKKFGHNESIIILFAPINKFTGEVTVGHDIGLIENIKIGHNIMTCRMASQLLPGGFMLGAVVYHYQGFTHVEFLNEELDKDGLTQFLEAHGFPPAVPDRKEMTIVEKLQSVEIPPITIVGITIEFGNPVVYDEGQFAVDFVLSDDEHEQIDEAGNEMAEMNHYWNRICGHVADSIEDALGLEASAIESVRPEWIEEEQRGDGSWWVCFNFEMP